MSEPIVFISKHKIKEGKMQELKKYNMEVMPEIAAKKPGTAFQYAYTNKEETINSFVHVFADAETMAEHMTGAEDRSNRAREYIEPVSMEIWGMPNQAITSMFTQIEASGVSVSYMPQNLGGYIRLSPV